ncbi:MAG: 50S ribosome-binding GTPase [Phycisphaerales bacterium]|nr:MAG: 50S ribosome-binding GTPase [Phycisphaerales bacterium]
MIDATWRLLTPSHAAGAVAIVQIQGDVETVLRALGVRDVPVGHIALRSIVGVDTALVARLAETCAQIMPHGGIAVIAALAAALERAGVPRGTADACELYPEASTALEARMLDALARCASPLGIDLLLEQPRRHEMFHVEHGVWTEDDRRRARVLGRLMDPALVAIVGAANIGKSTLLNAMARRAVSVVADEPGTTLDHVGVMVECDGVVVRMVDTAGIREHGDAGEREARARALDLVREADLVLSCGDSTARPVAVETAGEIMTLALRADAGSAAFEHDLAVSGRTGAGCDRLSALIRERLVPKVELESDRAWKFWDEGET